MSEAKRAGTGWTFAIDYLPLIAFFIAFKLSGVFFGTAVFMVAILVAVVVSKMKLGRVAPMLWLSAILILGFGALTIKFHDPSFIKLKPTIIYTGLGLLLVGGALIRRPLLRYVLEVGFEGLSDHGWLILSRNWGFFFLAMAAFNEVLRRSVSDETWLTVKLGFIPLSLTFGAAHLPFLMRNGLVTKDEPTPPVS